MRVKLWDLGENVLGGVYDWDCEILWVLAGFGVVNLKILYPVGARVLNLSSPRRGSQFARVSVTPMMEAEGRKHSVEKSGMT